MGNSNKRTVGQRLRLPGKSLLCLPGKTNTYKAEPPHSFKLKMAMAETRESLQVRQEEGSAKVEDNRVKAQSRIYGGGCDFRVETYVATSQEDTTVKIALTSHTPKRNYEVCHHA